MISNSTSTARQNINRLGSVDRVLDVSPALHPPERQRARKDNLLEATPASHRPEIHERSLQRREGTPHQPPNHSEG